MAFKPVHQQKAFLRVAAQISDAIERGEFVAGQMLPSERKLCQQMEVSRPVMREAMSALQLMGLVRTRAGLGSFVNDPAPVASISRPWTMAEGQSPADVMETRQILEPAGARLAAARFTPEAAAAMSRIVDQMRDVAGEETGTGRFERLDLQFHQAVADASCNDVISAFVHAIVGYSEERLRRALRDGHYRYAPSLARLYLGHHETTYAHLSGGRGDKAARSMFRHLLATQAASEGDWKDGWEQGTSALLASLPEHPGPGPSEPIDREGSKGR
ncbi:MAG: FadR/GntR family transcriptional regulator [Candidatus Dormibacteraceae bacterium]